MVFTKFLTGKRINNTFMFLQMEETGSIYDYY